MGHSSAVTILLINQTPLSKQNICCHFFQTLLVIFRTHGRVFRTARWKEPHIRSHCYYSGLVAPNISTLEYTRYLMASLCVFSFHEMLWCGCWCKTFLEAVLIRNFGNAKVLTGYCNHIFVFWGPVSSCGITHECQILFWQKDSGCCESKITHGMSCLKDQSFMEFIGLSKTTGGLSETSVEANWCPLVAYQNSSI